MKMQLAAYKTEFMSTVLWWHHKVLAVYTIGAAVGCKYRLVDVATLLCSRVGFGSGPSNILQRNRRINIKNYHLNLQK